MSQPSDKTIDINSDILLEKTENIKQLITKHNKFSDLLAKASNNSDFISRNQEEYEKLQKELGKIHTRPVSLH